MDNPASQPAIRFDSNRAWQQAMAALRANREVLVALAGVFFLLPNLAFSLLFPEAKPPAGADQQAMLAFASDYYTRALPYLLPVLVLQAAGTLGMLVLLTDRSRPTVGAAIRTGFAAVLPYLAAQLVLGVVLGFVAMPIMILFALGGSTALASVGVVLIALLWTYCWVRTALAAPVMAVEGLRQPIAALRRSWRLTAGNGARVLAFLLLITLAFTVVVMVITSLTGLVFGLLLPTHLALVANTLIASVLGAGMVLVLVATLGATHLQLADPEAQASSEQ